MILFYTKITISSW